MNKRHKSIILIIFFLFSIPTYAQTVDNDSTKSRWTEIKDHTVGIVKAATAGIEFRIKAGIAIGGTSPLPIPLEIQGINSFSPLLNTSLEAEFVKTFEESPWGLSFGLRLESKGMKTDAEVKNYNMALVDDGFEISGVWTGMVETKVDNSYLTLPVLALWKPSPRWDIKLGPYGSYVLSRHFSGFAYDGYLREGDPTGEKYVFEDGKKAAYDFSKDMAHWDYGMQLGADWRAFPHLLVGIDLTWGLRSVFKKDFETITFPMFPIYARLNFAYAF